MSVLIYDMPNEKRSVARQLQKKLNKLKAKMMQKSVWKSEKLDELIELGSWIRQSGGSAEILEGRFLF